MQSNFVVNMIENASLLKIKDRSGSSYDHIHTPQHKSKTTEA